MFFVNFLWFLLFIKLVQSIWFFYILKDFINLFSSLHVPKFRSVGYFFINPMFEGFCIEGQKSLREQLSSLEFSFIYLSIKYSTYLLEFLIKISIVLTVRYLCTSLLRKDGILRSIWLQNGYCEHISASILLHIPQHHQIVMVSVRQFAALSPALKISKKWLHIQFFGRVILQAYHKGNYVIESLVVI